MGINDSAVLALNFSFTTVALPGATWVWKVVGLLLVFAQGMWLNQIHNVTGIFEERSNTVLLMYVLFNSTIPATQGLSPALIAATFLIPAWHQIFLIYNQPDVYKLDFNSGFLIGVAALIYLPSLLMIIVLWTALIVIRTITFKDFTFSLLGLLLPGLYMIAWLILSESSLGFDLFNHLHGGYEDWTKTDLILVGVLLLIGILGWGASLGNVTMRRRNFYLLLIIGLLVGLIPFVTGFKALYGSLVCSSLALAPLAATYFSSFSRKWLPEALVTVWIAFVIAFQLIS